jgi:hypothetical protein
MSKCKLTVTNVEKFAVACNLANVQIIEKVSFGEIEQVVINFKQPEQLINLGKFLMQDIKKPELKEVTQIESKEVESNGKKAVKK